MRIWRILVAAALAVLPAVFAESALLPNAVITNMASATYSFSSGAAGVGGVEAGYDRFNVPRSFTAVITATDTPSMCMRGWKTTEPPTATIVESGSLLCFTISFSNCGVVSGISVTITDVMPGNTMRADDAAGPLSKLWVAGGVGMYGCIGWATAVEGPWYCTDSPVGQIGPIYLRWIFGRVGMHKSGYVRYCVTVL